jgi:type I restriction enzyme S subunit
LVRPDDIVYTKSPTGEFPYGIIKQSLAKENAAVSPLYGVYRPSTADIGTLIDFYFESPVNAKNYLHPLVQKGAKNTISIGNDQFLNGHVTLPENLELASQIASFIREARRELSLLNRSVAALTNQKRGLMQKLLLGKWRPPSLKEAECAADA